MLTFIQRIYKNQKKEYHLLLVILTFLASFEFTFLAMYDAFTKMNFHWQVRSSLHGIPALASLVALMLCVFATKYFIANKQQEFSILLLAGRKPKDLLWYLLIQFVILMFIANLLAIIIGNGLMYLINMLLQMQSHYVLLNYSVVNVCFLIFWYMLFTLIVILAISAHQFVSLDTDLAKHLSQKTISNKPVYIIKASAVSSKRKMPWASIILSLVALYLTVDSLFKLTQFHLSITELLMAFTFALSGIFMLVMSVIPLFYDLFHHYLLKHPILMNGLSSFNEFSTIMLTLAALNMLILPILVFLIFFGATQGAVQSIIVPCFIMMIIMIALCFLLRFSIYISQRQSTLATFHAIGYRSTLLNHIALIKNTLFLILVFVIPLLFMSELFYRAYQESLLSFNVIMIMMSVYFVVNSLLFIYTCVQESQSLKEVTQNVKYLNRGQ